MEKLDLRVLCLNFYYLDVVLSEKLTPDIYNFNGTVSQGAQEIFKLLPHTFVDAEKLPEISQVLCFYSFSCIKS